MLMAVCGSEYKFSVVDIGQPGSINDGGVWGASQLGSPLLDGNQPLIHITIDISCHISWFHFISTFQVALTSQNHGFFLVMRVL